MSLSIIKVVRIACQSTQVNFLVWTIPVIHRQHNILLTHAPRIWDLGYERTIDHVPKLLVVLQLLVNYLVDNCTTFTNRIRTELSKNMWYRYVIIVANPLYTFHDLNNHGLVI